MCVTGTPYLVINLHASTGLKQNQINKGSLYDPRNQINAISSLRSKGEAALGVKSTE